MSLTRRKHPMAAATRLRGPDLRAPLRGELSTAGGARNSESLRPLRSRRGKSASGRAARTSGVSWSRGMSAGGGTSASAGQSARHVPVLLVRSDANRSRRSERRHLCRRDVWRRRLQPRHSRDCRYAGDWHRPRPLGDRRGLRPGRSLRRTAGAGRRPILQSRGRLPRARARRGRRCRAWISASRRCSSTRPSAASRSASTDRSTCGWDTTAPSAADVVARGIRAIWHASSPSSAKRNSPGRLRARSPRRAGRADHDDARAGRHHLARGAPAAGRNSSRDAHVPGAADLRQRRTRRTAGGAARRPKRS